MDGYAARGEDVRGATESAAGAAPGGRADSGRALPDPDRSGPGECARIFTGAPLPDGRRQRDPAGGHRPGRGTVTIVKDRDVGVEHPPGRRGHPARHHRAPAGTELGPAQLGVLASLAVAHPLVYRRPRVAILGSGDEIVDVDQPEEILSGRKIASSNTHTLVALVRRAGGEPVNLGIAARHPGESARAPGRGAGLRPAGHHRRHQRGRARLRAAGARGAGRRAAVLEAADAARRAGRVRAPRAMSRGSACRAIR